jgi:signal transduction histidine kinase
VGAEIDRVALLSRIIGELPERDGAQGTFRLVDERGQLLHQWGGSKNGANHGSKSGAGTGKGSVAGSPEIQSDASPLATRALPAPLQGWRIDYFGPADQWQAAMARGARTQMLLRLGTLAALLLLLALFFWRESTRSLREARQRVDFVNQVSHELKTPLTNIRLYAEMLEDELDEDDPARTRLQVIRSESERLSRMILNILTFSRKERRKLSLSLRPVELDELVAETVGHFALSMEKRGMRAEVAGSAPRAIPLDRDAAGQVLANLLSNAEKYAASGGVVRVTLRQGEGWTAVEVSDRGAGIPWAQRERIFRPFYRISNQLSEGVSGTGIGLSIARTLAQMMGGKLELVEPGRGTSSEGGATAASSNPGATFRWILEGSAVDATSTPRPADPSTHGSSNATPYPSPTPPTSPGAPAPFTSTSTPTPSKETP